jgi:hypothetical protein
LSLRSHKGAQSIVDSLLMSVTPFRLRLEPIYQVGIVPHGKLLLDGTKEYAAPCAAPIKLLRYIARVDLIVRTCDKRRKFGLLLGVNRTDSSFLINFPLKHSGVARAYDPAGGRISHHLLPWPGSGSCHRSTPKPPVHCRRL